MNIIINSFFIAIYLMAAYSFAFGVNLRHWFGWIQVFFGFLSGVMVAWGQGIYPQLTTGVFFLILTMWLGNIRWRQRKG